MNLPKISILLPFRDAEDVLQRAVDSILEQKIPFELVLVENQDTESEIVRKLVKAHSNFKLVRETRRGIVHALNAGLAECSGIYIARMDADDEMIPDRLYLQSKFLDEYQHIQLVSGRVIYRGIGMEAGGYSSYVDQLNSIQSPDEIFRYRFIESPLAHPSVMFRKSAIDRYPLYREGDFPEDYELWLHWLEQYPHGMAKIQEDVLIWHDSEKRLSRNDLAYSEESFMKLRMDYLVRYVKKEHPSKPILIAGVGKKARKKIRIMQSAGLKIHAITDLRPRSFDQLPFIDWNDLPEPGRYLLVSLVSNRGSWREIERHLSRFNYINESDYILAT